MPQSIADRIRRRDPNLLAFAAALVVGGIYVGSAWSPSSYGVVLQALRAEETGIVAGTPKPIRSDEWGIQTPLTQAAVKNGLRRTNETSFWKEDLRVPYALPVLDWGLLARPTLALFAIADPATAFSFHYAATAILFLAGWALFFQRLRVRPLEAWLLSGTIFFTGIVQFWWTTTGFILAWFPWLLVVMTGRGRLAVRAVLFGWVATCWLLSSFYPPYQIQLAFLLAAVILALRPDLLRWREVAAFGGAAVVASAIACLYLREYLALLIQQPYPGGLRAEGGGERPLQALAHLLPTLQHEGYESLVPGTNICELGLLGTWFVLPALVFADVGRWRTWRRAHRRAAILLGAALLLVTAWLYLPLPSWAGMPLLWHKLRPHRLVLSGGLLLLLGTYVLSRGLRFRPGPVRLGLYVALVAGGWALWKRGAPGAGPLPAATDVAVLLPVAAGVAVAWRRRLRPRTIRTGLLAISIVLGAIAYGRFNPIQSARPIFEPPALPVRPVLDRMLDEQGGDRLVVQGYFGAVLNGLGYPSVGHVLFAYPEDRWRERLPGVTEETMREVLARLAIIDVGHQDEPTSPGPYEVVLPIRAFLGDEGLPAPPSVAVVGGHAEPAGEAGFVDAVRVDGRRVRVRGWFPWRGENAGLHSMAVVANHPLRVVGAHLVQRPDVAAHVGDPDLIWAGFELLLEADLPTTAGAPRVCLTVTAPDGDGPFRMPQALGDDSCREHPDPPR